MTRSLTLLLCVLCLDEDGLDNAADAVVVVNGLSVCLDHFDYAKESHSYHEARTRMLHRKLRVVKTA